MANLARYGNVQKSEYDAMEPWESQQLEKDVLKLRNDDMKAWATLMVMCSNAIAAGQALRLGMGES